MSFAGVPSVDRDVPGIGTRMADRTGPGNCAGGGAASCGCAL
jgi:hypothetical protein